MPAEYVKLHSFPHRMCVHTMIYGSYWPTDRSGNWVITAIV
jgi:hypothetical protein